MEGWHLSQQILQAYCGVVRVIAGWQQGCESCSKHQSSRVLRFGLKLLGEVGFCCVWAGCSVQQQLLLSRLIVQQVTSSVAAQACFLLVVMVVLHLSFGRCMALHSTAQQGWMCSRVAWMLLWPGLADCATLCGQS
jgi:hypothetical protein